MGQLDEDLSLPAIALPGLAAPAFHSPPIVSTRKCATKLSYPMGAPQAMYIKFTRQPFRTPQVHEHWLNVGYDALLGNFVAFHRRLLDDGFITIRNYCHPPQSRKVEARLIGFQAQDVVVEITLTHVSPETVRHMHHEPWGTSQCCTGRVGLSALVHCWC